MKLKKLLLPGVLLTSSIASAITTSCFWDTIPKRPNPGDQEQEGPNPSPNPGYPDDFKPISEPVVKWSYNGINYLVAKDDKINRKRVFYADMVMFNDSKEFKKLLPTYEQYEAVKNLTDSEFPTFAGASQFIRSLDPYKRNLIWISKGDKNSLDPKNFTILVKKVLRLMEESRISKVLSNQSGESFFNVAKQKSIEDVKRLFMSAQDEGTKLSWALKDKSGLFPSIDYDIPYDYNHPEGHRTTNINRKLYRVPSGLWKMQKNFDISGNWEANPQFLYREFEARKIEPQNKAIDFDPYDYMWINKAKVYGMQLPLYNMLISYLKVLKAFTNAINAKEYPTLDDINDNGSIINQNKTLRENFFVETSANDNQSIYQLLGTLENDVLEYMKLKNIMGFAAEAWNSPNMQMFPGGANYNNYETDFRDAYVWAHYQYHNFIQPLRIVLANTVFTVQDKYEDAFVKNTFNRPYYEMIWNNIKFLDKLDKPRVISQSEAESKFNEIVKDFSKKFGWKYK